MMHKTAAPKTGLDILIDNQTSDLRNVLGNSIRGGSGDQLSFSLDALQNADWDAMSPWSKSLATGAIGGGLGGVLGGGAAYLSPKKRGESKSQRRSRIMRQAMLGTGLGAIGGAAIPASGILAAGPNDHQGGNPSIDEVNKLKNLDEQHEDTMLPGAGWLAKAKEFFGFKNDPVPSVINQANIDLASVAGAASAGGYAHHKLIRKDNWKRGGTPKKLQDLQGILGQLRGTELSYRPGGTTDLGALDDVGKLQQQLKEVMNLSKTRVIKDSGGNLLANKDSRALFDALARTNNPGVARSPDQISKQLRGAGVSKSEVNQFLNNALGSNNKGVRNPQFKKVPAGSTPSAPRVLKGRPGQRIGGNRTAAQKKTLRGRNWRRGGVGVATAAGFALPHYLGKFLQGDSVENQQAFRGQLNELKNQLTALKGTTTEYPSLTEYQQILDGMETKYPDGYGGSDNMTLQDMLRMINYQAQAK
jgi:hypothetical protein